MERLSHLIGNGKLGALLAAMVLYFFLRQLRLTLVIAMTIPLCLLVALSTLYFAGRNAQQLDDHGSGDLRWAFGR